MIQLLTLKCHLVLTFNKHTIAQRAFAYLVGILQKALMLEKFNCTNTGMLLLLPVSEYGYKKKMPLLLSFKSL